MLEIEVAGINCPKCATKYECLMFKDSHVIWVEENWTGGQLQEIIFDESPFLQAQFCRPITTHPVRLDRVPGKKKNTYDYRISCPVCGEFTVEYKGVSKEVDVYIGADRGGKIVVFDWVPEGGLSKSEQVASDIIREGLIKGQGG